MTEGDLDVLTDGVDDGVGEDDCVGLEEGLGEEVVDNETDPLRDLLLVRLVDSDLLCVCDFVPEKEEEYETESVPDGGAVLVALNVEDNEFETLVDAVALSVADSELETVGDRVTLPLIDQEAVIVIVEVPDTDTVDELETVVEPDSVSESVTESEAVGLHVGVNVTVKLSDTVPESEMEIEAVQDCELVIVEDKLRVGVKDFDCDFDGLFDRLLVDDVDRVPVSVLDCVRLLDVLREGVEDGVAEGEDEGVILGDEDGVLLLEPVRVFEGDFECETEPEVLALRETGVCVVEELGVSEGDAEFVTENDMLAVLETLMDSDVVGEEDRDGRLGEDGSNGGRLGWVPVCEGEIDAEAVCDVDIVIDSVPDNETEGVTLTVEDTEGDGELV